MRSVSLRNPARALGLPGWNADHMLEPDDVGTNYSAGEPHIIMFFEYFVRLKHNLTLVYVFCQTEKHIMLGWCGMMLR